MTLRGNQGVSKLSQLGIDSNLTLDGYVIQLEGGSGSIPRIRLKDTVGGSSADLFISINQDNQEVNGWSFGLDASDNHFVISKSGANIDDQVFDISPSGALAIPTSSGITFGGGSDTDLDLIVANVTGTPKMYWDESEDRFRFTNGIYIPSSVLDGTLEVKDTRNFSFGTSTGTKLGTSTSQKIGVWNATPIIQPTTGIAEATLVENSGGTVVNEDTTFDGYTLGQVVKALRNEGWLA